MDLDQEDDELVDAYRDILFSYSAVWKADEHNIIMRKCATRKGKMYIGVGAVHVDISDIPTCTCPRYKYNRCRHIAVCAKIDIATLPQVTGVICEKPVI